MMKTASLTAPLAMLAALTLFSAPAFAQQGEPARKGREGGRDRSHQESSGRGTGQARPREEASAPRSSPRSESRREADRPRVDDRRSASPSERPPPWAIAPRQAYCRSTRPLLSPIRLRRRSYHRPMSTAAPRDRFDLRRVPRTDAYRYAHPSRVYGYRAPRSPVIIDRAI